MVVEVVAVAVAVAAPKYIWRYYIYTLASDYDRKLLLYDEER